VSGLVQFTRTNHNVVGARALQVALENLIGIEEVADNQVEPGEILGQMIGQFGLAREKARERAVFDRADGVGVKAFVRERRDVRVTENLDMGIRMRIAQSFDRRQRQDEVANRSAADDKYSVQKNQYTETASARIVAP
jgi:hypothetical protein